ncbi:hypothetical protein RND81_02G118800 [Saponaria officinalis]|uniref:S-protein homolog n=1 Tax=Saponaria officinalis TaxID=3572 RepID=A0AAW1MLI3_SAPOF
MSKKMERIGVSIILIILISILASTLIKDAHYESPSPFSNQTITPFPKNGVMFLHKFHVYIVNDLANVNSLDVHCRSKDIDKGRDRLDYKDLFEFNTRLNLLWMATKYWCYLTWDGGYIHNKTFWVDNNFLEKCNFQHCVWYAQKDGLYLKTVLSDEYEKFYEWGEW